MSGYQGKGAPFDEPLPPHVAGSDTSLAAAESMRKPARAIRDRVRAWIFDRGGSGATCDEIEVALVLSHQTASARVNELFRLARIWDSGQRRPTRSGRAATVWRAP